MENTNTTDNLLEERHTSPADALKLMIIDRWNKTDNFYMNLENEKFVRAAKIFGMSLFTQTTKEQKALLQELKNEEIKKIKEIMDSNKTQETKMQKAREIQFEYAEKRHELCVQIIDKSPISVKDFETDFDISDMEIDDVRKLVTGKLSEEDGGVGKIKILNRG